MSNILKLLLFVLVFHGDKAFADATPFNDNERIDLSYETTNKQLFDSCGIIYRNYQTNTLDTFFHSDGGKCITVADINGIRLIRLVPDSFKIISYYKNKVLTSPVLHQNGLSSYHHLLVTDTAIKDITPVFGILYTNYFIALLTTIFLELIVAFVYFRRHKILLKNLTYIVYINLCSSICLKPATDFYWTGNIECGKES